MNDEHNETPNAYDREEWQSEPYRDDADDRPTPYRELSRVERDMLFAVAHAVGDDGVAESVSAVADATDEVRACGSQVPNVSKYIQQLTDHGLVDKHNTDNVGEPTAVSLTNAGLWALAERRDELQRAIREVVDSDE